MSHFLAGRRGALSLAVAAALSSGCTSFSDDGGLGPVAESTRARVGRAPQLLRSPDERAQAQARTAELLREPLSPDAALELAFLNHPGLQARLAELGIAEADRVRAGRLPNPSVSFGRLSGSGVVEIDRALRFDVLGLLTLPLAKKLEQGRFEQAQLQAALDAVDVAAEARSAYFSAVAAQQQVTYAQQVKDAADASSELAQAMWQAGNFSKLDRMREQGFQLEAQSRLQRARHQAVVERERLVRALGLSGAQLGFILQDRLPELPARLLPEKEAEQAAIDQRLDVQMAKHASLAQAEALGLSQRTRMVNVLHAGYQNKSATGEALAQGYEIELELPVFDFGTARVARAQAAYLQSVQHTADVALRAQSDVREAYSAYRTAHELARHYRDEVVPRATRMSEEQLLRYNGMLISVFDLLAEARSQIDSVSGAIDALRDFWVAQNHLQTAVAGRTPADAPLQARPAASVAGATAAAH